MKRKNNFFSKPDFKNQKNKKISETSPKDAGIFKEHTQHPYASIPWVLLSDTQKAQFLLNSTRLLDTEAFRSEFKSFEGPDINS